MCKLARQWGPTSRFSKNTVLPSSSRLSNHLGRFVPPVGESKLLVPTAKLGDVAGIRGWAIALGVTTIADATVARNGEWFQDKNRSQFVSQPTKKLHRSGTYPLAFRLRYEGLYSDSVWRFVAHCDLCPPHCVGEPPDSAPTVAPCRIANGTRVCIKRSKPKKASRSHSNPITRPR